MGTVPPAHSRMALGARKLARSQGALCRVITAGPPRLSLERTDLRIKVSCALRWRRAGGTQAVPTQPRAQSMRCWGRAALPVRPRGCLLALPTCLSADESNPVLGQLALRVMKWQVPSEHRPRSTGHKCKASMG